MIETLLSRDTILDLTLGNRLQKGSDLLSALSDKRGLYQIRLITHVIGKMSVGVLGSAGGWSDAARKSEEVKMGGNIFPVSIPWLCLRI
jgi:hypothetical protein